MDELNRQMAQLFAGKARRRLALARLPFPEKVRAVVRLQEMAAPILRARGKQIRPWKIAKSSASDC